MGRTAPLPTPEEWPHILETIRADLERVGAMTQYQPGVIELPKPTPPQMEFNPECVCGHMEFSHRFDKLQSGECTECQAPYHRCNGFYARQKG